MRRHHDWEDRPDPDLLDPVTAAALDRAARDVRRIKIAHLTLVLVAMVLLAAAAFAKLS